MCTVYGESRVVLFPISKKRNTNSEKRILFWQTIQKGVSLGLLSATATTERMKRYQCKSALQQLVLQLNDAGFIPGHQRKYTAPKDAARDKLISTILDGGYLPPVLIRGKEVGGVTRFTLEDGQHRLTTLKKFMEGETRLGAVRAHTRNGVRHPAVRGVAFADMTAEDQERFRNYVVHIEYYNNATDEEALKTFHNVNRGSDTLKLGEVLHSQLHNAPLAQFAIRHLLNPESPLFQRSVAFWGEKRTDVSKRGKDLTIAAAMLAGIVYGSAFFNQKEEALFWAVSQPDFDEEMVLDRLSRLIDVWEAVDGGYPIRGNEPTASFWNYTKFNGFILAGMAESDMPWEDQMDCWVQFINECRDNKPLHKETLGGLAGTHASPAWWTAGWTNVFARYT